MADIYIACDLSLAIDEAGVPISSARIFFETLKRQGYKILIGAGNMSASEITRLPLGGFIGIDDKVLPYRYHAGDSSTKVFHFTNAVNAFRDELRHESEMPEISKKKFIFVVGSSRAEAIMVKAYEYACASLSDEMPDNVEAGSLPAPYYAANIEIERLVGLEQQRQAAYAELENYYLTRQSGPKRIGSLHRFFSMITRGKVQLGFERDQKTTAARELMDASNGRDDFSYLHLPALTSGVLGKIAKNEMFRNIITAAKEEEVADKKSGFPRI